MNKLRLAVIGSGGMAKNRMSSFSHLEGCELVALAARNDETGTALSKEFDIPCHQNWNELLNKNDIDAVIICTNNDSHGSIALAALKARKHVFLEYPLARHLEEGQQLLKFAESSDRVLRIAHDESISTIHRRLKEEVNSMGKLLNAIFVRLTPGRGARPETLFNLKISGPPSLFFIYHIYPLVDLFGSAVWVEGQGNYTGLNKTGQYERFVNTVNLEFVRGGLAQWSWAGGIAINKAEEFQRIIMSDGTLIKENGRWFKSMAGKVEELHISKMVNQSLEEIFLNEIIGKQAHWREDLRREFDAIRISLAAETSVDEMRRVYING